jgi:Interferon-induced transmembrane protein
VPYPGPPGSPQPPWGPPADQGWQQPGPWAPLPPANGRDRLAYGGADDTSRRGAVPNYRFQAILCTILFNVLAGVVAIYYSVQVSRKLTVGDWDGAARASRLAKTWCWVSVVVGVVFLALILSGIVPNPYAP